MLRSSHGRQQRATAQAHTLLVFSVGGRRLAAKTDEVASISEWRNSIPVPSRTPFVSAVMRKEDEVLPVFDLADLLHVTVQGEDLLCLTAKHPRGHIAICIDEDMPVLHTVDRAAVQAYEEGEFEAVGSFTSGFDQVPIISLGKLGTI